MRLPSLWRGGPLATRLFGPEFEKFFDEFLGRLPVAAIRPMEMEATFVPDVDVIEKENEYRIKADVPGLALEDVEVTMMGDVLRIRGEKKSEKVEEKENYRHAERAYGSFIRMIPFPVAVDPEKIAAKLEKGTLEVIVPKREAVKPRRIEVKDAARPVAQAPRPREERAPEKK